MWKGFELIKAKQIINSNIIKLEHNEAGTRDLSGTVIKNNAVGKIIYTPPQNKILVINVPVPGHYATL